MLQAQRLVDSVARSVHRTFGGERQLVDLRDVYHGRVYRAALDDGTLLAAKTVSSADRFAAEARALNALAGTNAPVPLLYDADDVSLLLLMEWCGEKSLFESCRNAYGQGSSVLEGVVKGIVDLEISLRDVPTPPATFSEAHSQTYADRIARNTTGLLQSIGRPVDDSTLDAIRELGRELSKRLAGRSASVGPLDSHPANVMIRASEVRFLDFALWGPSRREARFAEYLGVATCDSVELAGLVELYARRLAPPHGARGFREALWGHWLAYQIGLAQALLGLAAGKRPSDPTLGWLSATDLAQNHDFRIRLLDATIQRLKQHVPEGEAARKLHRILVAHL